MGLFSSDFPPTPPRSLLVVDLSARSGRSLCWIIAACLLLNVSNLPAQAPKLAVSSFPLDNITLTPPTFASLTTLLTGWVFARRRTVTRPGNTSRRITACSVRRVGRSTRWDWPCWS